VPTIRNGWRLLEYAAFTNTLNALASRAAALQTSLPPDACRQHPAVKLLARVRQIIEVEIPRDPNRPDYRLKGGLVRWRRVKFNGRLFAKMVANARPPETWEELEKTCAEMEPR